MTNAYATIDPDLVIFAPSDWATGGGRFSERIDTLLFHRSLMIRFDLRLLLSSSYAALISESFPWEASASTIPELRDLRQFVFDDLSRALIAEDCRCHIEIGCLDGKVCCMNRTDAAYLAIQTTLHSTSNKLASIASLPPSFRSSHPTSVELTPHCAVIPEATGQRSFPIVYDEQSWATFLSGVDWWPDVARAVFVVFHANSSMRSYFAVRKTPLSVVVTEKFQKSVEHYCRNTALRYALIEAITKKCYGILDTGLGDESLGAIRRFRVTKFWRVHYSESSGAITLDEFGPHSIGGVGT
jgi:hypothetical protein